MAENRQYYDHVSTNYIDLINDDGVEHVFYDNLITSVCSPGAYAEMLMMFAASASLNVALQSYCPPASTTGLLSGPFSRQICGRGVRKVATAAMILMWELTYAPTDFKTFKPSRFVILHSTRTHDTVNLSDSICSSVSYITHTQSDYDTRFPPLPVTSTPAKNETTFMPSPITSPLKCTSQKKRRIEIAQPVCSTATASTQQICKGQYIR